MIEQRRSARSTTGAAAAAASRTVALARPVVRPGADLPLAGGRALVVSAVAVVVLSRVVEGTSEGAATALGVVAILAALGMFSAFAGSLESGLVPGVLVGVLVLVGHLLAIDWPFVGFVVVAAFAIDQAIAIERATAIAGAPASERWRIAVLALLCAFAGFAGIAGLLPGALGGTGAGFDLPGSPLDETAVLLLAGGDALVAGLLGLRLARLGPSSRREAALSAASYAGAIAIGAGLLRAITIPPLLGPPLLAVLFYLWDVFHATTPSIRHDPRWRWQVGLLVVLGAVVIGWNLQLR